VARTRFGVAVLLQTGLSPQAIEKARFAEEKSLDFASSGLNFLPNDLDFPSPGFANPSTKFVNLAFHVKHPAALEASFSAREAPAVV
jgi:hypothetical protein